MDINLSILDAYFNKRMTVTVLVDIEESTPYLIFQPSRDPHTSRREFLSFKDVDDILQINGVYDGIKELRSPYERGNEKKINDLIYDTLAKYVLQMLNGASTAKLIYPELVALDKHKATYFRDL